MTEVHRLGLRGFGVALNGVHLVKGLDLEVRTGERVGLVGPSGVGKSTLLRAIAGLMDPMAGVIALDGRTPDEIGWPRFRARVVFVAQQPVLLDATVRENLERPFSYAISGRRFPVEEAESLIVQLGLEPHRMGQSARTLSVGQQQRVCLVRALLVRPDFLLLDEPTSALDSDSVDAIEDLLSTWTDEGRLGALIVSHDREQIDRWCHRAVDLANFSPRDAESTPTASELIHG